MTRSAAAQEPSMDEILASIRRIIETGDERELPQGAARGERAALVERLAPGPLDGGAVARLAAHSHPGRPEADAPADVVQPAFSSIEEEELAARLREELEASDLVPAVEAAGDAFARGAGSRAPEEVRAEGAGPGGMGGETGSGAPPEPVGPFSTLDTERAAPFVAANSDSRRMHDFRSAVLDDHASPAQAAAATAPLVSGRTGELVGASFDELAQAIRAGELRSLEDMAQELLRPMLQDWLDDNLPKLVERLVREEIERVARGGRR